MRYGYCVLFVFLIMRMAAAQRISNVRAEATGDFVTVYYDLEGTLPDQVFQVDLFSSHNQYAAPLQYVRGAVGPDVRAGKGKKIEWGTQRELGQYRGELTFDVRARLTFSPIAIQSPVLHTVYRRGKTYTVSWKGGLAGEKLRLELLREGAATHLLGIVTNTGQYTWGLPADLPLGETYRLKITAASGEGSTAQTSSSFAVRRKIPMAVRVLPLAALLTVGTVLGLTGNNGTTDADGGPIQPGPPDHTK